MIIFHAQSLKSIKHLKVECEAIIIIHSNMLSAIEKYTYKNSMFDNNCASIVITSSCPYLSGSYLSRLRLSSEYSMLHLPQRCVTTFKVCFAMGCIWQPFHGC